MSERAPVESRGMDFKWFQRTRCWRNEREQNGFSSLCDSLDADDNGRKERKDQVSLGFHILIHATKMLINIYIILLKELFGLIYV
jgi:hypothetical protein